MGKRVGFLAIVLILIAAIGGLWWYLSVPHTAQAQFARAEKLEKELQADAVTKSGKELEPKIAETIDAYRRVQAFGKSDQWPEALKRIAAIYRDYAKDNPKAIATLEELAIDFPDEKNAGFALLEEEKIIRKEADALKAQKKTDEGGGANKKYREAIAKLEDYRKKFEKGDQAAEALTEIGRIWQDGIEKPLIKPIEIFEQVLKDYPASEQKPEALYRLAKAYQKAGEAQRALDLYGRLLQEFPKNKWAADATYEQGKLLADEMGKHEEASEKFEQMAQDFPDDPRAPSARQQAHDEKMSAEAEKGEDYGKSRYGGVVPFDTIRDKPLPPAELLKQFTEQKLDAETYDLTVTFTPNDHRITVEGTMKFVNRGADKQSILLMLGKGLEISKLTIDGADAKNKHTRETLQIALPSELKSGSGATLGFTYTGQYNDAKTIETLMREQGFSGRFGTTKPATKPATTSAPATAPASLPTSSPAPDPRQTFDPQLALGEYGYGLSGSMWYPITIVGDVFDAHVTLQLPANTEAVSNGALVKHEKATRPGDTGRFEFQTKSPVFGLYFVYGPFVMQEKQIGDIHFYTYFHPENASKHDAYCDVANRILSFYGSKLAGFPYEKMAIVETPLPPILGGVGPASLMLLHEGMVAHKDVPENLLAHELAHQWFGNLIPINVTDPGYSQWLSEGFATYCDAMYTQFKDGPEAFAIHIKQYQQMYFQFAIMMGATRGGMPPIRELYAPTTPAYRPVVYEKGALVLHMLRKVMGDEKFFALLKQYVQTYKNQQSTVDDFRRLASSVYGQDLSWFFEEWFDRSVMTHWKVNAAIAAGTGSATKTHITITQPEDLVKMPADVTLLGEAANQRKILKDLMLDKRENELDAETDFTPVKVIVDEDNWVLKRLGTDNIWEAAKH